MHAKWADKREKPPKQCDKQNDSDSCIEGKSYTTYKCSPPVSRCTKATLTINSFEKGGDGGGPSACDNKYHSDNVPLEALSTGRFKNKQRCMHNVAIYANGRKVNAMVVDECHSTIGCDAEHSFRPPCPNNVVDASKAVWKALGMPQKDWGLLDVYWSDA